MLVCLAYRHIYIDSIYCYIYFDQTLLPLCFKYPTGCLLSDRDVLSVVSNVGCA